MSIYLNPPPIGWYKEPLSDLMEKSDIYLSCQFLHQTKMISNYPHIASSVLVAIKFNYFHLLTSFTSVVCTHTVPHENRRMKDIPKIHTLVSASSYIFFTQFLTRKTSRHFTCTNHANKHKMMIQQQFWYNTDQHKCSIKHTITHTLLTQQRRKTTSGMFLIAIFYLIFWFITFYFKNKVQINELCVQIGCTCTYVCLQIFVYVFILLYRGFFFVWIWIR